MGQHQHGIIVDNIFAQMIFFQNFAVGNGPDHIRTLCVHQIHREILCPAVLLQKLPMGIRVIADAGGGVSVGRVALYDGALYLIHHGLPKLRMQEILVALLAGMYLHRHFSGKRNAQRMIKLHHSLRGDFPCKINL